MAFLTPRLPPAQRPKAFSGLALPPECPKLAADSIGALDHPGCSHLSAELFLDFLRAEAETFPFQRRIFQLSLYLLSLPRYISVFGSPAGRVASRWKHVCPPDKKIKPPSDGALPASFSEILPRLLPRAPAPVSASTQVRSGSRPFHSHTPPYHKEKLPIRPDERFRTSSYAPRDSRHSVVLR